MSNPAGKRRDRFLEEAFAQEEYRGLRLAGIVRLVTLAVIAAWITVENRYPAVLFFEAFVVAFAVLGVLPLLLRRWGRARWWHDYLFPLLDLTLFVAIVLLPNPLDFEAQDFPAPVRLRFGNEVYLFVFLVGAVFTYSPRVVLWTGFAAALTWSVGTLWILALPESRGWLPEEAWQAMTSHDRLEVFLDPQWVELGHMGRLALLLLLISGGLAVAVWRSRRLVLRQVEIERERTNLSRHFSPNMVEELARSDEPLGATRTQDVAVLFADIIGFTALSESLPPEETIRLLREFHGRMAEAVFAHAGTLDKYLGDGIMATFGTPRAGERDAGNALRCGYSMVEAIETWNRERQARGDEPLRVGIGIHYGPVVLGDVGSEQRLEFAVIGDTVNVASRIEELTRELGVPLLVSDAVLDRAKQEGVTDDFGLQPAGARQIRGREGDLILWSGSGRRVQEQIS